MRVLNYRSLLLLAEGQTDEALKISIAMFRLSRHFDHEPMLIGYLVALACRGVAVGTTNVALRAGPPSDASRDALEAELARQDMAKHYRHALTTERAFGLQLFHETPNLLVGHLYMKLPMGKNDLCDYFEYMDFAIQGASRPYSDSGAQASAKRVLDRSGPLTNSVAPAIQATHEAHCRIQAEMRCLRVLNALARHGYGPQAEEPKLADLGLPADVLIDPYNGQPLHLKKLPEGWLIYSVGNNLKDDGGKLNEEHEDVGLGPITAQGATEKASE